MKPVETILTPHDALADLEHALHLQATGQRDATFEKRDGKWDDKLQCRVQHVAYDFCTRTGRLYFPVGNCCDMTGAIRLFTAIDPDVHLIETFAGGEPDTFYRCNVGDREWTAFMR
jgi:hypothetical protein